VFCAALLGGIGLARGMSFDYSLIVLSLCLLLACVRRQGLAALLAVALLGVSVGGLRGTVYMQRLAQYDTVYNQKVVLIGTAVDDAGYGRQSQLSFDLTDARVEGKGEPLVGRIGVSGFGTNVIFRGDTVRVEGKLRPADKGARQGYMSYATLQQVSSHMTPIDTFRRKFAAGMQSALPEPAASFAMGILIGQRATLPESVYDDLVTVGLVHIIAVSGYNLTIILRACMRLLGDRSKYQTFAVAITLIAVFLLITGASASIVRASIVSALSLAAWYYGRTFKPILLILLAAAITSYASPLYPWCDIGWYLSFLAFYGVLIISPQVHHRFLTGRFKNSVLIGIGLESLAAEVATLPLVLYIFGQLSAISLVANVAVAAFVPIAMLLSLVAGLAGMLITPFVGWFAWPATMVLTYMLDAAHILASIPYVFKENVYITLTGMVAMYVILIAMNWLLHSRLKRNPAIITALRDENTLLRATYK
jgi:competence protein ComEC